MHEVNFAHLGSMVAIACQRSKRSQEEVARTVGIHPVTLSRIEHGKLPGLAVALFARLALELDINPALLLRWSPGQVLIERINQAKAAYDRD